MILRKFEVRSIPIYMTAKMIKPLRLSAHYFPYQIMKSEFDKSLNMFMNNF